ncbi:MAG: carboxypeptidase-like regulatory domain-containing protein [Planctomycetes bacterium]|nr:carboxypeptidase-like regulatory domain-containing protein [Planctomycetota bacterium]
MLIRQSVPWLVASVFAAATLSGCHGLDRPVSVLVRDAETKAPVVGAAVSVSDTTVHPPHGTVAHTGDSGVAHLKVNPAAEFGYAVQASAPGYLPADKSLSAVDVRAISSNPFSSHAQDSPTLVMEVFSGPRPTIDLTVPTGYRGIVRVELRTREDVIYPPGQRAFQYEVPASGVVECVGPPVLLHGLSPDIRAKYADGKPLKREADAKEDEVALRWVSGGNEPIFVVGTHAAWDDIRKTLEKDDGRAARGKGSGTGGGGRGGGRHGGGGRGGGGGGMGGGAMGGR